MTSPMLKVEVKGAKALAKALDLQGDRQKKALATAVKVEGYNRLKQLRAEIKAGLPGGHPYAHQLSALAGRTKTGRKRKNQVPLYKLARGLRYKVSYDAKGNISYSFGFINRNAAMNNSYKKLVLKHDDGGRFALKALYSGSRKELGRKFAVIGGKLQKKGDPDAKYFFLTKAYNSSFQLPSRPIVEPFVHETREAALANIKRNVIRKLQGHRI